MIPYTKDIEIYSDSVRCRVPAGYLPGTYPAGTRHLTRSAFFTVLSWFAGPTTPTLTPETVGSILLFRNDAIGDYILTTPLIRWLAENCPNATIDVVGSERNKPLLLADPHVRNVYTVTHKRGFRASWFSRLGIPRTARYDLVLSLTHTAMTKAAIQAVRFGKGAVRVTHKHEARKHVYGKVFQVQVEHEVWRMHWTQTIANAAAPALGVTERIQPRAYVTITPTAYKNVGEQLREMGIGYDVSGVKNAVASREGSLPTDAFCTGRKYVVVNVSAFDVVRRWATEPCAEVVRQLAKAHPDVHFFVTGGPPDAEVYTQVARNVGLPNCSVWQHGIMELVALVAGASGLITPDTAVVHMAATCGVPVVSLYRKLITIAEWFPYNTKFRALLSPSEDTINNIHPDLIAQQAEELLWPTQ